MEQIISRIKKLLKHSESARELGSLEEAEAFAAKANELLLEYNLDRSKVLLSEEEGNKFANWMYGEEVSYKDSTSGNRWKLDLIGVICRHNLCSYTYRSGAKKFRVYGRMENVDVVVWMYHHLSTALKQMANTHYRQLDEASRRNYPRYTYTKDFLIGAVWGINEKLKKEKEASARHNEINALMVVNKDALKEYISQKVPNLKTKSKRTVYVGSGYDAGFKAGKNMTLNKPLPAEPSNRKIN